MDTIDNPAVFQFLLGEFLGQLRGASEAMSGRMAGVIGPVGFTLFSLYIVLWGMAMIRGAIQEPFTDGLLRIVRGVVILLFATGAGTYAQWTGDLFWEVPGAIASAISDDGASTTLETGAPRTAEMLDTALGQGLRVGLRAWNKMGVLKISQSLAFGLLAIAIWLAVLALVIFAAAVVVVASVGLSIVLGVGPLFILLAMFESTKAFFESWVRQAATFAVLFILMGSAISLVMGAFSTFLQGGLAAFGDNPGINDIVVLFAKVIGVSGAFLVVVTQVQNWSAGLAGGVAIAAAGALSRVAGQGLGAARGAAGGIARSEKTKDAEGKETTQYRGAVPAAARRASRAAGAAAAYLRQNQIRPT